MSSTPTIRIDNLDVSFEQTDLEGRRYLYHYTKAETALGKILTEQRLRLSPLAELNDPMEARWWVIQVGGKAENGREFAEIHQAMKDVKKKTRVLCFTSDGYDLRREPRDIENCRNACGFARPTMWAHYADNHRGIALVFDRQRLVANAVLELSRRSQIYFGHVVYRLPEEKEGWAALYFNSKQWTRDQPIEQCVLRHLEQHRQRLFFAKHLDWFSEYECRIVAYGDLAPYEFVSIKGALTTIILGDLANPKIRTQCLAFVKKLGVDVMRVEWHSGRPHLRSC